MKKCFGYWVLHVSEQRAYISRCLACATFLCALLFPFGWSRASFFQHFAQRREKIFGTPGVPNSQDTWES